MQKPVATLLTHPSIEEAQHMNLRSAAAAALLLLPARFTTQVRHGGAWCCAGWAASFPGWVARRRWREWGVPW